jgi:hypothetical protein
LLDIDEYTLARSVQANVQPPGARPGWLRQQAGAAGFVGQQREPLVAGVRLLAGETGAGIEAGWGCRGRGYSTPEVAPAT